MLKDDILKIVGESNLEKIESFFSDYENRKITESALKNLIIYLCHLDEEKSNSINNLLNLKKEPSLEKEMISVIIPTYNRKNQISECLNSIFMQSYKNFEIIIVDDCSTDGTEEYIKNTILDERVRYIKNDKNSGAGVSRKNGFINSNGEYLVFMDDDDFYIDEVFFEKCIEKFENEDVKIICSNSYTGYEVEEKYVFNKLNFSDNLSIEEYLSKFQFGYEKPKSTFTTMFRKSNLINVNFDNMTMVNDASIYLRALLGKGKVGVIDTAIGVYRMHSKNITFNIKADFLVENLNEKKYVYEELKKRKLNYDVENWFKEQMTLTTKYFIAGTHPSKTEKKKVYKWLRNNYSKWMFLISYLIVYDKWCSLKKGKK